MIGRVDLTQEDLEWSNDISFKIRFASALILLGAILILKQIFGIPFPLVPMFVMAMFEAFVNQPYFFIRKRVKSLYKLIHVNTTIDIVVITFFIHYSGGIEVPFFSVLYLLVIVFSGATLSLSIGIWLATLSSVAYATLISLEYFQIVGHISTFGIQMTGQQQLALCIITMSFFYLFCFFARLPLTHMWDKNRALKQKADQLREALNTVQLRADQLVSVSEICRETASSLDITTVLDKLMEQIAKTLKAERISIMLRDEKDRLTIKASIGIPTEIVKSTSIKMGEKISGWVASNQEPLLIENIDEDPRFVSCDSENFYSKSLISCPLVVKNNTIGVININNKEDHTAFNPYELEIIKALCSDIAVAIENARLYSELRQSYINTVESLATAVDTRDHYTQGHLHRVCDIALNIGKKMNLEQERLDNLRIAALLHDIGKIGISDNILLKPDTLSDTEWVKMKEHPIVSERIIKPLRFPKEVSEIVRHHHERYDGKGYPDGKAGEDVSLEAYILGIADAFDAMMSERPYRKSLGREKAIEELHRCRGSQFHPQVVDTYLLILENS